MSSGASSSPGPWTLWPLIPSRGLVFAATESGFVRSAVMGNIAAHIGGKVENPILPAYRRGHVLICSSIRELAVSATQWTGVGADVSELHWFGSTAHLLALIKSAPGNTAAVFVDAEAASPDWQNKAETVEVLDHVAQSCDHPIVVFGTSGRQSGGAMSQVPRHFQKAQHLLTVTAIEQDEHGGGLLNTHLVLIAKTAHWAACAGVSFNIFQDVDPAGVPTVFFSWRELLQGTPDRLAREAKGGSFSPAVRAALQHALDLLTGPMFANRLWQLLGEAGHADSAIEKALSRGEKRGQLAKNPVRNADGTFLCWQWRRVNQPWPFPTSGTQSSPPSAPLGAGSGVEGMGFTAGGGSTPGAGFILPGPPHSGQPSEAMMGNRHGQGGVPPAHPPESHASHPYNSLFEQVCDRAIDVMEHSTFDSTTADPKRAVVESVLQERAPQWLAREDIKAAVIARLPDPGQKM